MEALPFSREDFSDLLDLVSANAARRPSGRTYLMTSDVAWQFPGCDPKSNIRLWRDQHGLVGYVWFQPPDGIKFDIRDATANFSDVMREMLSWAEKRRHEFQPNYPFYIDLESMDEWADVIQSQSLHPNSKNHYLAASALETDDQRIDFLESADFTATKHFEPILMCALDDVEVVNAPPQFTLRQVEASEFEKRVAVHSAAWAPASGFNLERYLKVRAIAEVFDPELDIVAEDADGTFASYTIAWKDPGSLIGSFEPFGTRPEYRGTGVSQAVIGEGIRRLRAKGMRFARIYTASFNHQAARLYKSCGFKQVDVNRTFLKKI